jgi:transcription antitermination factor NusG
MVDARPDEVRRWYACYTRARHEKRVAVMLEERGFECFLPLVERERKWKDRVKVIGFPMFPSYVFGRFDVRDTHTVLDIPGVSTIVRPPGGTRPLPVCDEDIANVRRLAASLARSPQLVEVVPYIPEGAEVEVMTGPFAGVRGRVIERLNRRRVLVGIEAIGQALEIDVDARLLQVTTRTVA